MTILLLYIVEFNEFHIVVFAYLTHRLVDRFSQLGVQDETYLGIGITFLKHVNKTGKRRTEILAIILRPIRILILAHGRVSVFGLDEG